MAQLTGLFKFFHIFYLGLLGKPLRFSGFFTVLFLAVAIPELRFKLKTMANKRVDFVYFHIEGPHNSLELQYALRSIEKYFDNDNYAIHIIGEKPNWLNEEAVNFIPVKRISGVDYTVYFDVINKFRIACNHPDIGNNFFRMMDDIFFINPIQLADLNLLLAQEDFALRNFNERKFNASGKWSTLMKATLNTLRQNGYPEYSYAHHLPQKFNKTNLFRMFDKFRIPENLYLIGTLYNNCYLRRKPDHLLLPSGAGIKLGLYTSNYTLDDLHRLRKENLFMNHSVNAFTNEVKQFLEQLFPEKSKFEK